MVMVTITAMATAMANGNGNSYGNGWRGWQQWRLMAITMAMVTVAETAMAMANGNGDGHGWRQWQWQRRWLTMMAMAAAMEMATAITMATALATATMTVTTTDTREGYLFMCRKCAALWQGWCLASPPWAQRSVHCPVLHQLSATAKSVCSISRGMDPESSPWIVFFIFFNYLFSLLHNPLFPHTNSVPQEPCQPIDGLPRFLLYFFSR